MGRGVGLKEGRGERGEGVGLKEGGGSRVEGGGRGDGGGLEEGGGGTYIHKYVGKKCSHIPRPRVGEKCGLGMTL